MQIYAYRFNIKQDFYHVIAKTLITIFVHY